VAVRRDVAVVGLSDGTVTDHVQLADQPLAARLSTLGVQAYMGILFGPINQIVLAGTAIGLLCMIVWGYRMWWLHSGDRWTTLLARGIGIVLLHLGEGNLLRLTSPCPPAHWRARPRRRIRRRLSDGGHWVLEGHVLSRVKVSSAWRGGSSSL
jgi:hypothetical protein